jgi:RNA recognition motif-containing protein
MAKKIYVGNLNFNTTEEQLNTLFAQYGTIISASIVTDRYTGRSRGFGFVEMEDSEAADAAISALDGQEFDRRALELNEANKKPNRSDNRY